MSIPGIPGLGQIAPQHHQNHHQSTNRIIQLRPFGEWRFQVPRGANATVRVLSGTAERDGTELALNRSYSFTRTRSKILTWTGCTLEISGELDSDNLVQYNSPEESSYLPVMNLHFYLHERRQSLKRGPRVLICGTPNTGKSTVARTLVALATRAGSQPLFGNIDPREGLLTLPGCLSAAVFGTVMDVEDPEGGTGVTSTPSSGPSAVPVKLPMAYYFGREKMEDDFGLWKELVKKLASSVRAKFEEDEIVKGSGIVLDSPGVELVSLQEGIEGLVHAVEEFAINVVVVLGGEEKEFYEGVVGRLKGKKTVHGEEVEVVGLEKIDGVVGRDEMFAQANREASIKEYFFGDGRRTLSPFTQSVGFDDVAIFKASDDDDDQQPVLEQAEISEEMAHWTLAVMNASVNDPPETIQQAPVIGWVAIANVDEDKRRLRILSPVSGRLGNQPMVWGRWPEPYINLIG
ncbi:mRNA cleavage and polyadenylation factor CLP1 [Podospora fimiseda]|uniref:Polynucleotide 5'-hydroxyl-kinase GRC3 n=1 Tax=Podospora fimiseda TaxID=252190 RepID=A0AAN7BQF7_9PEZI|nr:mRNA cleavage and polyadenylation factor CLP1 [Podospora fimiseda]